MSKAFSSSYKDDVPIGVELIKPLDVSVKNDYSYMIFFAKCMDLNALCLKYYVD